MGKDRRKTVYDAHSPPCPGHSNSHGGPSEDLGGTKFKAGDVSWVLGYRKGSDFRAWKFDFDIGSTCFLSCRVYSNEEERAAMYSYALLRAARIGDNDDMHRQIQLLVKAGYKTEDLLERLTEYYDRGLEAERNIARKNLFKYKRVGSLTLALKEMHECYLECLHKGEMTDDTTLVRLYDMLLEQKEISWYRMYKHSMDSESGECESMYVRRVIEKIARDVEGLIPDKAGDRNSNYRNRQEPFGGGAETQTRQHQLKHRFPCRKCGDRNCKWFKSKRNEDCPGSKATCEYCKGRGHLARACFKKRSDAQKKTAAGAETYEEYDANVHNERGDDDVVGFSGVSISERPQPFF